MRDHRVLGSVVSLRRLLWPLFAVILVAAPVSAQLTADDAQPIVRVAEYGDAPDDLPAGYAPPLSGVTGRFPTRANTTNSRYGLPGAHALAVTDAWLGPLAVLPTREAGVQDVADPDTIENLIDDDFDNGLAGWPCPSSPPPAPWGSPLTVDLQVDVSVAAGAPNVIRYLNLLIDLDQNGVWSGVAEWAVIDFPVTVVPGTTQRVTVPTFSFPLALSSAWARLALTRTPVVGSFPDDGSGWDGSGSFSHGEIEDYLLASSLDHAAAAAFSSATATAHASAAAAAAAHAADIEFDLAQVNVGVHVQAAASASAAAAASASAAASAAASAQASAAAAAQACVGLQVQVDALAIACASCPCASACGAAHAAAAAAAAACGSASSSASASAASAASASAQANAFAAAAAAAYADAQAAASAFAVAYASAQATAAAIATSSASASASASAAATASADALAAACGGQAAAAASAAATAATAATAAASASASAYAAAFADAYAFADAGAAASAAASAAALAVAHAGAAAFAHASASASASASADASASAAAAAAVVASASASASASCSGDCCTAEVCCEVIGTAEAEACAVEAPADKTSAAAFAPDGLFAFGWRRAAAPMSPYLR